MISKLPKNKPKSKILFNWKSLMQDFSRKTLERTGDKSVETKVLLTCFCQGQCHIDRSSLASILFFLSLGCLCTVFPIFKYVSENEKYVFSSFLLIMFMRQILDLSCWIAVTYSKNLSIFQLSLQTIFSWFILDWVVAWLSKAQILAK